MALAALPKPLPQIPPEPRAILIADVIAGAHRVAARVEKGQYPYLLKVAQELPSDGNGRQRQYPDQRELPPPHPGEEKNCRRPHDQHQRGAEVGLAQNQGNRRQDHRHWPDQIGDASGILIAAAMEIAGQRQDQGDFHQF